MKTISHRTIMLSNQHRMGDWGREDGYVIVNRMI